MMPTARGRARLLRVSPPVRKSLDHLMSPQVSQSPVQVSEFDRSQETAVGFRCVHGPRVFDRATGGFQRIKKKKNNQRTKAVKCDVDHILQMENTRDQDLPRLRLLLGLLKWWI